jgi:DNA gyrase subunit A
VACVDAGDELMLVTQQGKVLRMVVSDVRPIGRATQGVRLIEIGDDDRVVSMARLVETDGANAGDASVDDASVDDAPLNGADATEATNATDDTDAEDDA